MRAKTFRGYAARPGNRAAVQAMQQFSLHPRKWIVLTGGRGTGKTHLMAAVANDLLDCPPAKTGRAWPLYVIVPDFLAYVRSAFDRETGALSGSAEARIKQAIDADVLLLDDLGAEQRTAWADETLYRIINARYSNESPTVFATNAPFSQMEPRIASRLQDWRIASVVAMTGHDERTHRIPTVGDTVAPQPTGGK